MRPRLTVSQVFNEEFEKNLNAVRTNEQAYQMAEQRFERDYGFRPYSDYDSFRISRLQKKKRAKSKLP